MNDEAPKTMTATIENAPAKPAPKKGEKPEIKPEVKPEVEPEVEAKPAAVPTVKHIDERTRREMERGAASLKARHPKHA